MNETKENFTRQELLQNQQSRQIFYVKQNLNKIFICTLKNP